MTTAWCFRRPSCVTPSKPPSEPPFSHHDLPVEGQALDHDAGHVEARFSGVCRQIAVPSIGGPCSPDFNSPSDPGPRHSYWASCVFIHCRCICIFGLSEHCVSFPVRILSGIHMDHRLPWVLHSWRWCCAAGGSVCCHTTECVRINLHWFNPDNAVGFIPGAIFRQVLALSLKPDVRFRPHDVSVWWDGCWLLLCWIFLQKSCNNY